MTEARKLKTDERTSRRMRDTLTKNTGPELVVRRLLHGLGARFRIANKDLPGNPDVANRSKRWAIFVHGCYWHHHLGCPRATIPKRNRDFWIAKFEANRQRDERAVSRLEDEGYAVLVVWECELKDVDQLRTRLASVVSCESRAT